MVEDLMDGATTGDAKGCLAGLAFLHGLSVSDALLADDSSGQILPSHPFDSAQGRLYRKPRDRMEHPFSC
jgi:hypothetical protein